MTDTVCRHCGDDTTNLRESLRRERENVKELKRRIRELKRNSDVNLERRQKECLEFLEKVKEIVNVD